MYFNTEEEITVIIIDNGSYNVKAGITTSDKEMPDVAGLNIAACYSGEEEFVLVANNVLDHAKEMNVVRPFVNGRLNNKKTLENVINSVVHDGLNTDPSGQRMILTEDFFDSDNVRTFMSEIAFEKMNVSDLYIERPAILEEKCLLINEGVVVHFGDSMLRILPFHDDGKDDFRHIVDYKHSTLINYGGSTITQELQKRLFTRYPFLHDENPTILYHKMDLLKQQFCYVAEDIEQEKNKSYDDLKAEYQLNDGTTIEVGKERYEVPEMIFNSQILHELGKNIDPIQI
ncbi:actin, putative [Entamoeba invadens IP1]|uniref:Actin, putative n=1 Tax=Entamoeba invadens IP1 TaxID=370355 RepID=A0A0A1U7U5_ENTIV|nr:actin, putative [Entamoeba invadens IP1]ELP90942.1 actin, putative [Entamoeba invadens IP1]|eukprot:XP_004257713.1 actin, putative [Entamoeba invadens IP1]